MTAQLNPLRTLIVDDSKDECVLLCAELRGSDALEVMGFVHDGVEALAYLRGTGSFRNRELFPYPDLLLLDFQMPRCGGIDVLQELKHQFYKPRVILWSNALELIDVPLALHLGADIVCQKPFGRAELFSIIERLRTRIFYRTFTPVHQPVAEEALVGA
jgi:two-component system response regulator